MRAETPETVPTPSIEKVLDQQVPLSSDGDFMPTPKSSLFSCIEGMVISLGSLLNNLTLSGSGLPVCVRFEAGIDHYGALAKRDDCAVLAELEDIVELAENDDCVAVGGLADCITLTGLEDYGTVTGLAYCVTDPDVEDCVIAAVSGHLCWRLCSKLRLLHRICIMLSTDTMYHRFHTGTTNISCSKR